MKLKLNRELREKLRKLGVSLMMGAAFDAFPAALSQSLRELADEIDRQNV